MEFTDKNKEKTTLLNREKVASVLTGIALMSLGGDTDVTNQPESPRVHFSQEEKTAQNNAREEFRTLKAGDIVECDVTEIESGPEATYQGKKVGTLKLRLKVAPGEKYNDPWFQKEQVGDYAAEIKWRDPGIRVLHDFHRKDGRLDGGAAVPLEDFDSRESISPPGPEAYALSYRVHNDTEQVSEIIVPFNNQDGYLGQRTVTINEDITPVVLTESFRGTPLDEKSERKSLSQTCATLEVNVQKTGIHVISAQDADGQPVIIKN